jgi:histidine ammonia-lyase
MSGAQALQEVGLTPIRLGPKEGLALINGTQFMTALGALHLLDAEFLCRVADFTGAMSIEAMRGTTAAFDADIHQVRPHPGQIQVAKNIRNILIENGQKSEIAKSHENCGKVQDPYSLRCIPQVHGASRDTLAFVRQVLEREINSVTDNPLVFPEKEKIISGGNFHGQIVSIAMDALSIASAELASISEQRLEKLINPAISELPAFLTAQGGLNSGFMIVQVAAAAIVSENKTLCHPASVDSIPTSADKEDHVSMGAWAARKAGQVVSNTKKVLIMELLAAAQGIDFLRPKKSSMLIENVHQMIRARVSRMDTDRSFTEDYEQMHELLNSSEFRSVLEKL